MRAELLPALPAGRAHVMGHEVVGTVVETGSAATRVRKGDRVAISPMLSCVPRGLLPCESCQRGDYPLCLRFFDGGFAKGMPPRASGLLHFI